MRLRRFYPLLIILFVYSACSAPSANIDLQNEKDVRNALATTWETAYMENRVGRSKVPESMVMHVVFNENGTYTTGVKSGVIKQSGEWSYNPKTQMLNIGRENVNSSSRIIKLTRNELISSEYTTSNDVIMDSTVITYKRL